MEMEFFNDSSRWQKTREWSRSAAEPFIERPAEPRHKPVNGEGRWDPSPAAPGEGWAKASSKLGQGA